MVMDFMAEAHETVLGNRPFGITLSNLITFFRPEEWLDKIQMNIGAAFIIILDLFYNSPQNIGEVFRAISIFIIYQFFLACYGYAVNAYADREIDLKVGKYKGVSYFSNRQLAVILIFLSIGSLGIPFMLDDLRLKILGIIAFILSAGYSLKPIRLKNRGFIGIIGATLPQRPLMVLFFGLLINAKPELIVILTGWALLIGVIMEIGHQMLDYENDKITEANTWIVNTDILRVKNYSLFSVMSFLLFLFLPVFYFTYEKGFVIALIMFVLSGHSVFYFIKGWKKYNKSYFSQ